MTGTPVWPTEVVAYGEPSRTVDVGSDAWAGYAEVATRRAATFEEQGYVVLRGLLDRELLEGWARHVIARYREADEPAATPFTRTLDPERWGSGTVRWGTGMVPIPSLSLELAATLDALAGGWDRLVPSMADYLSVSRYWPRPLRVAEKRSMSRSELGAGLLGLVPQLLRPIGRHLVAVLAARRLPHPRPNRPRTPP